MTVPNTKTKVVWEKTAFRSVAAISQCRLSVHPSKYWLRAALLDFDDVQSHAPIVQLPVLFNLINIIK